MYYNINSNPKINKKFNMPKLSAGRIHKFTNAELFDFNERSITIVDNAMIENEHILKLLNNAKSNLKVHGKLSKTPLAHQLTPDIQEKILECRAKLIRVRSTADSIKYLTDEESKESYSALQKWMRKARRKMGTTTRIDQASAVKSLSAGLDANPEIVDHLESLGIYEPFVDAVSLNNEIIDLTTQRAHDRGHLKGVRFVNREQSIFSMQILFDGLLAMAHLEGEDQEDYQEICIAIDSLIIEMDGIRKTRIARKHGEEVEDESNDMNTESDTDSDHNNDGEPIENRDEDDQEDTPEDDSEGDNE